VYLPLLFLQLTGDEYDVSFSDREFELDEPGDLSSIPWSERLGDCLMSPLPSLSHSASLAAPLRTGAERSGRDTPASVDSIPLEWDHDYDLSRGLESASRALGLASEQGEHGDEGSYQGSTSASALSGQSSLHPSHPYCQILRITHPSQLKIASISERVETSQWRDTVLYSGC
jgi:nesprin-1